LDLKFIESVARQIAEYFNEIELKEEVIIVEKSTVPVCTSKYIKEILQENQKLYRSNKEKFIILSNPEFMAEDKKKKLFFFIFFISSAIQDLLFPDRILIGSLYLFHNLKTLEFFKGENNKENEKSAVDLLKNIYEKWVQQEKIIYMNIFSSELSKIVANSFLAQRISSINSISEICERVGSDVQESKSIKKNYKKL